MPAILFGSLAEVEWLGSWTFRDLQGLSNPLNLSFEALMSGILPTPTRRQIKLIVIGRTTKCGINILVDTKPR